MQLKVHSHKAPFFVTLPLRHIAYKLQPLKNLQRVTHQKKKKGKKKKRTCKVSSLPKARGSFPDFLPTITTPGWWVFNRCAPRVRQDGTGSSNKASPSRQRPPNYPLESKTCAWPHDVDINCNVAPDLNPHWLMIRSKISYGPTTC